MRNSVRFLFKWMAKVAKYICPNAWWAIPFSVLVVGLTARVVGSRIDWLGGDNYWIMQGVEKPLLEYIRTSDFGIPLMVYYWVSYRVFGSSLTGYLVLPLISSLATLLVIYFGIKKQWGQAAWGVCFLTLAFMAFNAYSVYLAGYAMFSYGNELLVSCGLFFLFVHLSSGTLTKRQWTWVALISIPVAFFSTIYTLVLVFVGAVSVIAVRYWHSHGRYRLNDLRQHVMEMWPLALFPVVSVFVRLFDPRGSFFTIRDVLSIFKGYYDTLFFPSSNYPKTFWGAVQFVSHNTVTLLRQLLQTAPYKGSHSLTPSIFILVVMLIIILVLAVRMLQRRLKPDMSFVVTFTILALSAMAVGGLLGIYPYGRQRYSLCLLLPMGLIIAYAASFVITKIMGRFGAVLRLKAIPFVLASIIIVAGTVCNVGQLHYNTGITVSNWAALHQIGEVKADLVLIGGWAGGVVKPVYPDFYASAHYMGWPFAVLDYSDTVPPEIVDIIEGTQNERAVAAYTASLVIDYVATGPTPTPTLTLYPVADTTVEAQRPTTNFGTETQVAVQAYKSSDRQRGLFQFDLSSIPAGSTINSATFSAYYDTYYLASLDPVGRTYCLYRNTSPWTETEVNWNNQPSFATTQGSSTVMPESFGWVNWNVKDIVQTWVDGATNYGLVMMDSNETEGVNSLAMFYANVNNVNADTILVIEISKMAFYVSYPHWGALLAAHFDITSEIKGPSIWAGYYTRR